MIDFFPSFSLSFPKISENSHFKKYSLRVPKRIFATYDFNTQVVGFQLSEKDQDFFSRIDPRLIFPVPNKWGKRGRTLVQIKALEKEITKDIIGSAYRHVIPQNLKPLLKSPYLDQL